MRIDFQKEFLDEQKSHYKAMKALVAHKHEIRINFSKSKTFQLIQLDNPEDNHQAQPHACSRVTPFLQKQTNNKLRQTHKNCLPSNKLSFDQQDNILYEVIPRQKSKMMPLLMQQLKTETKRNNMSRSYRRKKKNSLHNLNTISQSNPPEYNQNVHLSLKNVEFVASTYDSYAVTKNSIDNNIRTLTSNNSSKTNRQTLLAKYPKYSHGSFLNDKSLNRVEAMIPITIQQNKSYSEITNKLSKKYKFQSELFNQHKTHRNSCLSNYSADKNNQYLTIQVNHPSKAQLQQWEDRKRNEAKMIQNHPFIKHIKASNAVQKHKLFERRGISQAIRSRAQFYVQSQHVSKGEQAYRPWTVLRNGQQKIQQKIQQKLDSSPEEQVPVQV